MSEESTQKSLKVSILSPEKNLFSGEVASVVVPGEVGSFGIYPNHAPLVASLGIGIIQIRKIDGSVLKMVVDGGFVEVRKSVVNILADGADSMESINIAESEARLAELAAMPASLDKVKEIKKAKTRILLKQN
ncbi:ATP synthase F1 subunit epsilon [Leptospira sp. GIMC2001]|uniref:ATP synthase F1 subunit epsilon n=1 Tax=Leptospira sp. GIMC2001 TaxID=1513297 RepID=UPI002349BE22|nr:ATP synthase F1 subunit epsilon [Leptospira sp. GIMC2001]WCL48923.1 ATP synthase F1 subunit epsilon [Leptospira sp. GIMC2001]